MAAQEPSKGGPLESFYNRFKVRYTIKDMNRNIATLILMLLLLTIAPAFVDAQHDMSLVDDDSTPPDIYLRPDDLIKTVGETGHSFEWAVRDETDTSGGYFLYIKMVEISSMWILLDTGIWNAEEPLTYSLDGFEEGLYYFRFRADDWSLNSAEHTAELIVVTEMDPPEIEHSCSLVIGDNNTALVVDFTVTDSSGIATIIISHTADGTSWENQTITIDEPEHNKEITGSAWLPSDARRYKMLAEDMYGSWAETEEVIVIEDTTPSSTTGTSGTTTNSTIDTLLDPMIVPVVVGVSIAVVIILIGLIVLRKRS